MFKVSHVYSAVYLNKRVSRPAERFEVKHAPISAPQMISTVTRFVALCSITVVALSLSGCGRKVNKVYLQFENDFAGLVVIRAQPDASIPFSGRVIVPRQGEFNVSERNFYGDFRINAARQDGTRLKVELLSKEAPADEYAVWWFPDGAYIRYFFLGRRDEMERFYQLNKERLYQVEESRLKRSGNSFELKTAQPSASNARPDAPKE